MLLLKCIGIGMLFMIGLIVIIMIAIFLLGLLENILLKIEELFKNETLKDIFIISLFFVIIGVSFGFIIYFYQFF